MWSQSFLNCSCLLMSACRKELLNLLHSGHFYFLILQCGVSRFWHELDKNSPEYYRLALSLNSAHVFYLLHRPVSKWQPFPNIFCIYCDTVFIYHRTESLMNSFINNVIKIYYLSHGGGWCKHMQ